MEIYFYMLFFALAFYGMNKMVHNKIVERIMSFIIFSTLFIVSALRFHVGTDYGVYLNVYSNIENRIYDGEGMEIGYFYLNKLTKYILGGEYTIFIVTSLIIIGLVYITVIKFSLDPILSLILFMCIGGYIDSFNIIRQSISIAVIFFAYRYCETKIQWIIPMIVASLFHKTAILVIPFFLISKLNLKKKDYLIIMGVGILLYLSYERTVMYLTNFIEGFEHYQNSNFVTDGANPIRTLVSISIFIFCSMAYDEICKDKKAKFAFTMVIFATIFALFMRKGKIFARVVGYFDIFQIILIPYVIAHMKQIELKKYIIFISIIIVGCSSFYFYYTVKTNQANIVPYRTYVNEITKKKVGTYD